MATTILAGTDEGIHLLGAESRVEREGDAIGAMAVGPRAVFAVTNGTEIVASSGGGPWIALASLPSREARCLLPTPDGLLVGTTDAHLLRLLDGSWAPIDGFESVAGRDVGTPLGAAPPRRGR
jgi:hypothetical protein